MVEDTCPSVSQDCKTDGADGLSCCGAEHGPGFAFCQTDPDYVCCSGDKWAISCSSKVGCSVDDQGIPQCKKSLTVEDTCPGVGQDCKTVGADGCLAVVQSTERALPSAKLILITCAAVVTSGQSAVHPRLDAQLMTKEFHNARRH